MVKVRNFLTWFQEWDNLSNIPETEFDYDKEWEHATPFEFIQSRVDLRGSTADLEKAHEAIVRTIHENSSKPSSMIFSSDGEKKKIDEAVKDFQSLSDDIRQELFARGLAISINEKLEGNCDVQDVFSEGAENIATILESSNK